MKNDLYAHVWLMNDTEVALADFARALARLESRQVNGYGFTGAGGEAPAAIDHTRRRGVHNEKPRHGIGALRRYFNEHRKK